MGGGPQHGFGEGGGEASMSWAEVDGLNRHDPSKAEQFVLNLV